MLANFQVLKSLSILISWAAMTMPAYTHSTPSSSFHFLLFDWCYLAPPGCTRLDTRKKNQHARRESESEASQQKKVFYRIVRRAISCGKFFLLSLSSLFREVSATLPAFLCSTFPFVSQSKERHLIGWRASQIGMEEVFFREGCDVRRRERISLERFRSENLAKCDKKSWNCVMGGYFILSNLCWFPVAATREKTVPIRSETAILSGKPAQWKITSSNRIFHFLEHQIDDRQTLIDFLRDFPSTKIKLLKLQVSIQLRLLLLSLKPWKRLNFVCVGCCRSAQGCVTALLDGIFVYFFLLLCLMGEVEERDLVTTDQNRSPWKAMEKWENRWNLNI